jgi:ankyrin repeat protein
MSVTNADELQHNLVKACSLGDVAEVCKWVNTSGTDIDGVADLSNSDLEDSLPLLENPPPDYDPDELSPWTPLTIACFVGHLDVVKCLVELGAEVDLKFERPDMMISSLHYAVGAGHRDIAQHLLAAGADIEAFDGIAGTVLQYAINFEENTLEMLKFLVESGAQVNRDDQFGRSVLIVAASDGNVNKVKYLVESAGAEIEKTDRRGRTALVHASTEGHVEVVKYLVAKGARMDVVEYENGWTALILASVRGHLETVKFLVRRGSSLDTRTLRYSRQLYTDALSHAESRGQHAVASFLRRWPSAARRHTVVASIKRVNENPSLRVSGFLKLLARLPEDMERVVMSFVGEGEALLSREDIERFNVSSLAARNSLQSELAHLENEFVKAKDKFEKIGDSTKAAQKALKRRLSAQEKFIRQQQGDMGMKRGREEDGENGGESSKRRRRCCIM